MLPDPDHILPEAEPGLHIVTLIVRRLRWGCRVGERPAEPEVMKGAKQAVA